MKENTIFEVVLTTNAKGKNGTSEIHIETSVKGLIFRCEVYMDSHLIDAEEVNCSDISTVDRYEDIFEARYKAAHRKFEQLYTKERIYSKVLSFEGAYNEGEGTCLVTTSVSDNNILYEAFLDNNQIDQFEETIDKAQAADEKVFRAKYTQGHKNFIAKYIKILKFPANTFLNPVLKKMPMYKKSPMYALGFFIAIIVLVLWILSIIVCGKALKKLVAAAAGKEAGMVVKDLQKTMCKKGGAEDGLTNADGSTVTVVGSDGKVISTGKVENFVVLPENVTFKDYNQIYPVYIKNNLSSDVLILLKSRIIFDFSDALVSPDMIINILSKSAMHVKASEIGMFEFKLEDQFLQSATLEERNYHGSIILEATNLQTKETENIKIGFDFMVSKNEDAK